jgi:hypothetical protein
MKAPVSTGAFSIHVQEVTWKKYDVSSVEDPSMTRQALLAVWVLNAPVTPAGDARHTVPEYTAGAVRLSRQRIT